ncbi:hypothetical protein HYT84_02755 [Candidatus Micrarchaeota archaeon]|nr:hypothetical protein [Candidatus Micrarchaeota archaeon]
MRVLIVLLILLVLFSQPVFAGCLGSGKNKGSFGLKDKEFCLEKIKLPDGTIRERTPEELGLCLYESALTCAYLCGASGSQNKCDPLIIKEAKDICDSIGKIEDASYYKAQSNLCYADVAKHMKDLGDAKNVCNQITTAQGDLLQGSGTSKSLCLQAVGKKQLLNNYTCGIGIPLILFGSLLFIFRVHKF